uniref:Uncharacterized protein n=1 Tax=Anguilla anguilla TaxID=7936 RepID=A0A0E9SVT0_ANGAN
MNFRILLYSSQYSSCSKKSPSKELCLCRMDETLYFNQKAHPHQV